MTHDHYSKDVLMRGWLIGHLLTSSDPPANKVAAHLVSCTRQRRCHSAACPACGRDFQAAAASTVDRFIREPARAIRGRKTFATIIPSSGCLESSDLSALSVVSISREIVEAFASLSLPPAIVAMEVSYDEDATGFREAHWSVHFHATIGDWLSQKQRAALRALFLKSDLVDRPVKIDLLDEREAGRLYPWKPERCRRVRCLFTNDDHREPYHGTKDRNLRPWQAVRLALVEHQLGFHGRLLTHGIDDDAVRKHLEGLGWARDGP